MVPPLFLLSTSWGRGGQLRSHFSVWPVYLLHGVFLNQAPLCEVGNPVGPWESAGH